MTEWEKSKEILKKYFKKVFDESGVEWTSKNDKEIDKLLDLIRIGSKNEAEKLLEDKAKRQKRRNFGGR